METSRTSNHFNVPLNTDYTEVPIINLDDFSDIIHGLTDQQSVESEIPIIDIDKFFDDIEEIKLDTEDVKDEFPTFNMYDSNYAYLENCNLNSNAEDEINLLNDEKRNVSSTPIENTYISISSNEEGKNKNDESSLEDDIPLSILVKQNDERIAHNFKNKYANIKSEHMRVINVYSCAEANRVKMPIDECSTPTENFKLIDEVNMNGTNYTDSDDNGYHSSDFEFISENEATSAGIIINKHKKTKINRQSKPHSVLEQEIVTNYDYRLNHVIPQGEDYLDMFRGNYVPVFTHRFENKSCRVSTMNVDLRGTGFHWRTKEKAIDNAEHQEETKEVARMIAQMYPNENKKRRLRYF